MTRRILMHDPETENDWGGPGRPHIDDFEIVGVQSVGNTIYFYSDVDRESILSLNRQIRALGMELRKQAIDEGRETPAPIYLRIRSDGGGVFSGIAGMETIRTSPVPVTTVVEGAASSAATFLAIVGSRRLITRHSFMMVHQMSSGTWGKYEELKDEMRNVDRMMETIKDIYIAHTRIPAEKLDEILKHDLLFTAKECVEFGLADGIEE